MDQKCTPLWIWYPGDFELWQHCKISLRREERQALYPAIWKLDSPYVSIRFRKQLFLEKPETVSVHADGNYSASLDSSPDVNPSMWGTFSIPAGTHTLYIYAFNQTSLPSIYVQGENLVSDGSWDASFDGITWVKAGCWNLADVNTPPSRFSLPLKELSPVSCDTRGNTVLADFGKEIYARLKLTDISGSGKITVYFGESVEEALSTTECTLLDDCIIEPGTVEHVFPLRACRYANVVLEGDTAVGSLSALFEYLSLEYRGSFRCSDDRMNTIWDISRYTLHLNTREFFLDGIKRDGWVWSGDAYQSYLMNYYVFFDKAVNQRTMLALRGKDPVTAHINTILDYSFYWFLGLYDYYLYTGDLEFIRQNYDKALTLMDFCLKRRNSDGMVEGLPGDWVFIDWADFDTTGEMSAEQMLLFKSLETMAEISALLGHSEKAGEYASLAAELKAKILSVFWSDSAGGFVTTRKNGICSNQITRHASIFSLLFGITDSDRNETLIEKVLLNPAIAKIKTPYFRFYELAALCEARKHGDVYCEMLDYWGGMLDLGATTFWEEYDPTLSGAAHYAMYGRPFGKSLCHAWGASPIYLLGRYFLGVRPLTPGYATFEVKPVLGPLEWMEGTVPTPEGDIRVTVSRTEIKVTFDAHQGILRFQSTSQPTAGCGNIRNVGGDLYELDMEKPGVEYAVSYTK